MNAIYLDSAKGRFRLTRSRHSSTIILERLNSAYGYYGTVRIFGPELIHSVHVPSIATATGMSPEAVESHIEAGLLPGYTRPPMLPIEAAYTNSMACG